MTTSLEFQTESTDSFDLSSVESTVRNTFEATNQLQKLFTDSFNEAAAGISIMGEESKEVSGLLDDANGLVEGVMSQVEEIVNEGNSTFSNLLQMGR